MYYLLVMVMALQIVTFYMDSSEPAQTGQNIGNWKQEFMLQVIISCILSSEILLCVVAFILTQFILICPKSNFYS
jgi:hypothetical protein